MTGETPSLGEVLHRARQAGGEQRPRPWPPEDWADRDPRLQALDEAMAAAVATVVREQVRSRVLEVIATFRIHYGQGQGRADDLAEAVRQVLDIDREAPQERSDEKESP